MSSLRLTFEGGRGEEFTIAISLDECTASDLMIPVAEKRPISFAGNGRRLDRVVEVLRRKQFRKDLFIAECRRLGTLLAERMEDAEGWHDESRVEPAKSQLKDFQRTQ